MKQVATLSVALVVALIGSYLAWTDDGETVDASEVALYAASEADIESIRWNTETKDITVTKRADARGDYFWIESVERVVPNAPEAPKDEVHGEDEPAPEEVPADETPSDDVPAEDAPADAPAEPAEPTEKRVAFLGNEETAQLWADYAPLTALRELPADSSVPDSTFGLDTPEGTLEVVRRGQKVTMSIGGETYGSKDRYVRYEGRTFLVDDGDLRPLQFASTRLVERGLYPDAEPDIQRISVESDGRQDTFVQQNRDDKAKAFWARAATPEEPDDTVETWVGKLLKMRLRAYADEAEVGPLTSLFRFKVEGEQAWAVEVLRAEGPTGTYYARTEFNRSLVELTGSIAKNIHDDLGEILPAE